MKQKSYYRNVFQRKNALAEIFSRFFQALASYPRLVLEVFIKGQFGVRYFSLASVITITMFLGALPLLTANIGRSYFSSGPSFWEVVGEQKLYYGFIVAFVLMSIKRYREIKTPWGVVDPTKFTLSMGVPDQWLRDLQFNGKPIDGRYREVLVEPAIFFTIGIVLSALHSILGPVLLLFSWMYAWSFYYAYRDGDHWVMDINDERLAAASFKEVFVDGKQRDESGFEYRGSRPISKDEREKIYNATLDDDDDIAS